MKYIKIEIQDDIQWIRLARPEKRNAFQPEMIQELTVAFSKASVSKERALVLTGEGESFCAGGDLDWMKASAQYSLTDNLKDAEALFDMYQTVRECPVPIIGRVHGHAMGGGLGLLAVCDIVGAENKTQFCFSEVKWGLVPAVISSFVLAKTQPHKAREWMLTAKVFSSPEALSAGLIHFAGTLPEVDAFVQGTLALLRKAGPEAVRETKKLLSFLAESPAADVRKRCTTVISERRVSPEGQAGLKAFLEKKPTPWG